MPGNLGKNTDTHTHTHTHTYIYYFLLFRGNNCDANALQYHITCRLSCLPLSYRVPVRERYGSTLLPATREQHDQNCTQSH